jgi:hypothetical protein
MSLCYDFEKWTMISLATVAISLTIGLISLAYGQELNTTQLTQNYIDHLTQLENGLQEQKEALNTLINYCYQHADRPNPLQDLIDKGFLSPYFKGITCLSVKDMISDIDNRITVVQTELNKYWENVEVQRQQAHEWTLVNNTTCLQHDVGSRLYDAQRRCYIKGDEIK